MHNKFKVCVVVTSSYQIDNSILPYITQLAGMGSVLLISSDKSNKLNDKLLENIHYELVPIVRSPSPLSDLKCLFQLYRILKKYKPTITYSISPKAGLLTGLAGFLALVPVRIHMVTGQVWATKKGAFRTFLRLIDKLICTVCTQLIVDSKSQLEFLISQNVLSVNKGVVLAGGSISGVSSVKFKPDLVTRDVIRRTLNISPDDITILFMGRLVYDKGIFDLIKAFEKICEESPQKHLKLILIGPDDGARTALVESIAESSFSEHIMVLPATDAPQDYFNASDVFCIPSYREGFPQVIIQAASTGIPTVGSRIYGITDAIIDKQTGLLHTVHDPDDLADKLSLLINDQQYRKKLGLNAYQRAIEDFSEQKLVEAFKNNHLSILEPWGEVINP